MASGYPGRRRFLKTALSGSGAALISVAAVRAGAAPRVIPAQLDWASPPAQVPATEGIATLPGGARLWYFDTGGKGEPVVLLHPASGSGAIWAYQQPVLAAAGYRVIGYSRRGYGRSAVGPEDPGTASADLHELADFLGIDRFHLVGSAAGGFIVPDYALSHPKRLLSMVIASSLGGVQDEEFSGVTRALLPKGFADLPMEFREVGPSYRAANPAGLARWVELHEQAQVQNGVRQRAANSITWATLATVRTPTLLLTGDADLYMPPSRLRDFARHLPGAETIVVSEAGHSAYWEQPLAFNRAILEFFRRHPARARR